MTSDHTKTQVHYIDEVGWVMVFPSLQDAGPPVMQPLPENDVVRVTDAEGHETLLQLVDPEFLHTPPAENTARPVLEPVAYPVAVTVEGLHVEVPQPRKLSARLATRARGQAQPREPQEPRDMDPEGVTLLDSVTFAIEPGELVAAIGPSGAGKSTLIKAMIGDQEFTGTVTYNTFPLDPRQPETVDNLRHLLGYVPQEDILHRELPLKDALLYSARLRLPRLTRQQQHHAVDEVLASLGLAGQAEQPLRLASGGERKRASVATELLTRPAVLYLDEPTTGLDPDTEESLLRILRELAHSGRHTLLIVTHSIPALEMADKVLVIARGRVAYVGAPEYARSLFTQARFEAPAATPDGPTAAIPVNAYAAMYRSLRETSCDWAARFEGSTAYQTNVEEVIDRNKVPPERNPGPGNGWASRPSQFFTLAQRNIDVIRGAHGYAVLLTMQAPALLLSLLLFLGWNNLSGSPDDAPRALLTFLVFSAVAVGLVNSCREIVKELPVYSRERTVGLSVSAYLLAKFGVLAALCLGQSLVLSLALFHQGGPSNGLLSPWRIWENWLLLWVGMLATVSLGLLVSALAKTDVRAQVMIPIILVLQLLFTGALLDVQKPVIQQLGYITGSYWLFSGVAASNDLIGVEQARAQTDSGVGAAALGAQTSPSTWSHEPAALITSLLFLLALTVAYLLLAGTALKKLRPAPR